MRAGSKAQRFKSINRYIEERKPKIAKELQQADNLNKPRLDGGKRQGGKGK